MTSAIETRAPASLSAWVVRDLALTLFLAGGVGIASSAYDNTGHLAIAVIGSAFGFVAAYALCYVAHEWGHLLGARAAGVHPPLGSLRGPILARFDHRQHSRAAFLYLSWGGVLGYLAIALLACAASVFALPNLVGTSVALGGAAFVAHTR